MNLTTKNRIIAASVLILHTVIPFTISAADMVSEHTEVTISNTRYFDEKGGEALFRSVCQGCHMTDASGAKGAAQYPALANDIKLAGAPYPIYMVLKGQGAMPGFASFMSDGQVADVVNYVRSHFGNAYTDIVAAEDVKKMR